MHVIPWGARSSGRCSHEPEQSGFCGAVSSHAGRSDLPGSGAHHDDASPAPPDHVVGCRSGQEKRGVEIDTHRAPPRFIRHLGDRGVVSGSAGIIDEDLHRTEESACLVDGNRTPSIIVPFCCHLTAASSNRKQQVERSRHQLWFNNAIVRWAPRARLDSMPAQP